MTLVQGRGDGGRSPRFPPSPGVLSLVLSLREQRKNGKRAVARNLAQLAYKKKTLSQSAGSARPLSRR